MHIKKRAKLYSLEACTAKTYYYKFQILRRASLYKK